jgi:hypothetical protein
MALNPPSKASGPTLLTLEDCNSYEANAVQTQDTAEVASTGRKRSGLFLCCFGGSQANLDAAVPVPGTDGCVDQGLDCSNGGKGPKANGHVSRDSLTGDIVKQPADSPAKQAQQAGASATLAATVPADCTVAYNSMNSNNSSSKNSRLTPMTANGSRRLNSSNANDWHDAVSHFSDSSSDHPDQTVQLQEVDKMVKELGAFKACYVPDPPLLFGSPDMKFVPVPANLRLEAFWERIEERTSPFPQPIDIMLKLNFLIQKTHKSIPGMLIHETSNSLKITAIPNWLPPGINTGYEELFDKSNKGDSYWNMRRDMKLGR